jgi:hypothetical protein
MDRSPGRKRYIHLTTNASGLVSRNCSMGAMERLDMMLNDAMYAFYSEILIPKEPCWNNILRG